MFIIKSHRGKTLLLLLTYALSVLTDSIPFLLPQLCGGGGIPNGERCGREACRHSFPSQRA